MKFRIASFVLLLVSLLQIATNQATAQVKDSRPIIGRWDLTVQMDRVAPSWLEVKLSGLKTLVGYFVAEGGSARPIAEVKYDNGKVSFSIPTQWDMSNNPLVFEGMLQNDQLSGTITTPKGDIYPFTGERAPLLTRTNAPVWGEPIALFNGKDLTGWHMSGKEKQWVVEAGVLKSPKSGSNIITDASFNDFKLHIEFRYPAGSNSGVYLRGRYEVQVEDNYGLEPSSTLFGGIYGFFNAE